MMHAKKQPRSDLEAEIKALKSANKKLKLRVDSMQKARDAAIDVVGNGIFDMVVNKNATIEEAKLVRFFRSEEGEKFGMQGDHDNLSPADTAIRAIRDLRKEKEALQRVHGTRQDLLNEIVWLKEALKLAQKQ